MTDTLRDLDAAIARARGWERSARGEWWQHRASDDEARVAWAAANESEPLSHPPPFSSSWALAGILLEEMPRPQLALVIGDSDWRSWFCEASPNQPTEDTAQYCATPCVAIARAWLAWHRSKP